MSTILARCPAGKVAKSIALNEYNLFLCAKRHHAIEVIRFSQTAIAIFNEGVVDVHVLLVGNLN